MYVSLQRIRSHGFIYKQRWLFSNKSCLKSFTFWKKLNEVSETSAEFYSKVLYKSKVCKDFSTKPCPRFCTGIHCSCQLKLGEEEIFILVFDLWISCRLFFLHFYRSLAWNMRRAKLYLIIFDLHMIFPTSK